MMNEDVSEALGWLEKIERFYGVHDTYDEGEKGPATEVVRSHIERLEEERDHLRQYVESSIGADPDRALEKAKRRHDLRRRYDALVEAVRHVVEELDHEVGERDLPGAAIDWLARTRDRLHEHLPEGEDEGNERAEVFAAARELRRVHADEPERDRDTVPPTIPGYPAYSADRRSVDAGEVGTPVDPDEVGRQAAEAHRRADASPDDPLIEQEIRVSAWNNGEISITTAHPNGKGNESRTFDDADAAIRFVRDALDDQAPGEDGVGEGRDWSCPKCGNDDLHTRYCDGEYFGGYRKTGAINACDRPDHDEEGFHHTCRTCQHKWTTFDALTDRPADPPDEGEGGGEDALNWTTDRDKIICGNCGSVMICSPKGAGEDPICGRCESGNVAVVHGEDEGADRVRIWSGEHGMYWRENRSGYTERRNEAGVYSRAEAEGIIAALNPEKNLELHPVHADEPEGEESDYGDDDVRSLSDEELVEALESLAINFCLEAGIGYAPVKLHALEILRRLNADADEPEGEES